MSIMNNPFSPGFVNLPLDLRQHLDNSTTFSLSQVPAVVIYLTVHAQDIHRGILEE